MFVRPWRYLFVTDRMKQIADFAVEAAGTVRSYTKFSTKFSTYEQKEHMALHAAWVRAWENLWCVCVCVYTHTVTHTADQELCVHVYEIKPEQPAPVAAGGRLA
jgi:hypothetical protein